MELLALIGIFVAPVFTLGAILIHYDHPLLGIVAIIISLFFSDKKNQKRCIIEFLLSLHQMYPRVGLNV